MPFTSYFLLWVLALLAGAALCLVRAVRRRKPRWFLGSAALLALTVLSWLALSAGISRM